MNRQINAVICVGFVKSISVCTLGVFLLFEVNVSSPTDVGRIFLLFIFIYNITMKNQGTTYFLDNEIYHCTVEKNDTLMYF